VSRGLLVLQLQQQQGQGLIPHGRARAKGEQACEEAGVPARRACFCGGQPA